MMPLNKKYILLLLVVTIVCSLLGTDLPRTSRRASMSEEQKQAWQVKIDNEQASALNYRELLPPSNLTHEIIDNVNVMLKWDEPSEFEKISYHDGIPYDGYVQYNDDGYGTVFNLQDYPGCTLEVFEFRHSDWDLMGDWEYELLLINWDNGELIDSIVDTTTVNDGWERDISLGSLPAVERVGIFVVPKGNLWNDAYPVLDFDQQMNGHSIVIDTEDYSRRQYTGGDYLMDLYVRPAEGLRSSASELIAAPRKQISHTITGNNQTLQDPTGYNIYRNESLIAHIDRPDSLSYFDADLEEDTYQYYVTAVYDEEESDPSNIVTVNIIADLEILLYDNFSDYPNFVTSFPPWTTIDLDESITFGFTNFTFPGEYQPMAWIIFNPYETNPNIDNLIEPHSGNKMAASFSSEDNANDNWLISERITLGTNSSLSFFAQSFTPEFGLERLRIGVSLTDPEPGSFQFIYPEPPDNYAEIPALYWEEYNIDLTDFDGQSIYLAFHCISDRAHALFLDSIKIVSVGGSNVEDFEMTAGMNKTGNYPNPFNPETTIFFDLHKDTYVTLEIYNIKGQIINTLTDNYKQAGHHTVNWNGKDINNQEVASGVYYYRITTETETKTGKMLLVK